MILRLLFNRAILLCSITLESTAFWFIFTQIADGVQEDGVHGRVEMHPQQHRKDHGKNVRPDTIDKEPPPKPLTKDNPDMLWTYGLHLVQKRGCFRVGLGEGDSGLGGLLTVECRVRNLEAPELAERDWKAELHPDNSQIAISNVLTI